VTGWSEPDAPSGEVTLVLDQPSTLAAGDDLRDGLSAVVHDGSHLWLVNDETTSLERLTLRRDRAEDHRSFDLTGVLDLPGDQGEIDIEGLDVAGDHLWLIGSHSAARRRVEDDQDPDGARNALATVELSPRRRVLARLNPAVHLVGTPNGTAGDTVPAVLGLGRDGGDILELLADDRHLRSFVPPASDDSSLPIPGKDNGIDFEGLAVADGRVFIGLRGPVLRGWAVILELDVGHGPNLQPQPIGPDGQRFRKHFLDLRGLGVRDLCRHGDDLLVLAGPTMELDGRIVVYRWGDALTTDFETVVRRSELKRLFDVPFGKGEDRAEGITVLDDGDSVLVVYDTPAKSRKTGTHGIRADIFPLDP